MSSKKKKCLLLTYVAPRVPGGGGEVRSYHVAHSVAEFFDLTVVNLGGTTGTGVISGELRNLCKNVIEPQSKSNLATLPKKKGRIASWIRLLLAILLPWKDSYRPYLSLLVQHATTLNNGKKTRLGAILCGSLNLWSRFLPIIPTTCFMFDNSWRKVEQQAETIVKNTDFDVVWIEHTLTWPFAKRILNQCRNNFLLVCSSHNVENLVSQRLQDSMRLSPLYDYFASQTRLIKKMEISAWKRSDLIIQCSEADAALTRSASPNSRVVVVPNGVDTSYFRKSPTSPPASVPTVLFTAGFGYHPNVEAVEWFLNDIFPKVLDTIPTCQFIFAGSEAASLRTKLAKKIEAFGNSVECISDPPDIRPCFEKAWVYVVPLLYGGGTRLKILEAMSMQLPVVSTTVGAEGVPYVNQKHLLLADTPTDFHQAVIQLLQNQPLRNELSTAGFEFATHNYDWQQIRQHTTDVLRENCL